MMCSRKLVKLNYAEVFMCRYFLSLLLCFLFLPNIAFADKNCSHSSVLSLKMIAFGETQRCSRCSMPIVGGPKEKDGKKYCSSCYTVVSTFNNSNFSTSSRIECSDCHFSIVGSQEVCRENGKTYCRSCYDKLHAPSCSKCGWKIKGDPYWYEGRRYCENCYSFTVPKCSKCYAKMPYDYRTIDGKKYCVSCYDELGKVRCADCKAANVKFYEHDGKNYCGNCYAKFAPACLKCSSPITGQVYVVDGGKYCEKCYETPLPHCSRCSAVIKGDVYVIEGKKYCQDCKDS